MSNGDLFGRWPRDRFVVETDALETRVQDAGPPVRQLSHGLAMGLFTCAHLVVVAPRTRRTDQGTEGQLVDRRRTPQHGDAFFGAEVCPSCDGARRAAGWLREGIRASHAWATLTRTSLWRVQRRLNRHQRWSLRCCPPH